VCTFLQRRGGVFARSLGKGLTGNSPIGRFERNWAGESALVPRVTIVRRGVHERERAWFVCFLNTFARLGEGMQGTATRVCGGRPDTTMGCVGENGDRTRGGAGEGNASGQNGILNREMSSSGGGHRTEDGRGYQIRLCKNAGLCAKPGGIKEESWGGRYQIK